MVKCNIKTLLATISLLINYSLAGTLWLAAHEHANAHCETGYRPANVECSNRCNVATKGSSPVRKVENFSPDKIKVTWDCESVPYDPSNYVGRKRAIVDEDDY